MSANNHDEQPEQDAAQHLAAEGNKIGRDLTQVILHLQKAAVDLPVPIQPGSASAQTVQSIDFGPNIIFKGLRSFDGNDAKFFLSLLPGPFDDDGLPESIRFWKTLIEETDPDKTFRVGLLYGPSGCGKSSLMDAGIIPHLADSVIAVHVEATGQETETRLLSALRRYCPDLPPKSSLLSTVQNKAQIPAGKKVLIVIDQFEQWRPSKSDADKSGLMQMLSECDGEKVQCVLMVRDNYWTPISRFLKQLKIQQQEGKNTLMVDLFDKTHAKRVLTAFGRAFGILEDVLSIEQEKFLDQAVAALAQEDRVVAVRLALFAEMMKDKAWTLASLRDVGGTQGVGEKFLEATFAAATAPQQHRHHQEAVKRVLKELLPETGTEIKGHMQSQNELLEASGYSNRPTDFDELISILDNELRLITPTAPEGKRITVKAAIQAGGKYYQLTHDYLVHSIRDWLNRKQRETRRGRAELLLADQAALWNARQENRQLPSFQQWLNIRLLTATKDWRSSQRKMMQQASRYHAVRGLALSLLLIVATVIGLAIREQFVDQRKATQAFGLVQAVLNANTAQVPTIISEMAEHRKWTDALLREEIVKAAVKSRQMLHASLALLPVDATQVDYLFDRLLDAAPHEVSVIRDALVPHKDRLLDKLWLVVEKPDKGKELQRLRAAAALAMYDPENEKWAQTGRLVVDDLVKENPVFLGRWSEGFRFVKNRLLSSLYEIFRDHQPERTTERFVATNLLADYAADQPSVMANLVMDADEKQFAVIFPKFKEQGERGLPVLVGEIDSQLPPDANDEAKDQLAKRQANAAVALLRTNQPERVWPLLKHSPDPRVRSYLIHRIGPLRADAGDIVKRLGQESNITIRRALILSLGEYDNKQIPADARIALLEQMKTIFLTTTDPGLRASAEWLLRTWQEEKWLKQANDELVNNKQQRDKRLEDVRLTLVSEDKTTGPLWYATKQGQTMVVIPGLVGSAIASPNSVPSGKHPDQKGHWAGRPFAISAHSVTWEQYVRMSPEHKSGREVSFAPSEQCPVSSISWYMAAQYCNWLSKEENIPEDQWCYIIDERQTVLKANYQSLPGYRLPTILEMEYAARAGASTSRYYGETDELLPQYAWYQRNAKERTWPVGSLKPNDFGLFDMQGNVFNWCQDLIRPDRMGENNDNVNMNEGLIDSTVKRAMSGGSFYDSPFMLHAFIRIGHVPTFQNNNVGFRVARTFMP